jgi:hypothetical protein
MINNGQFTRSVDHSIKFASGNTSFQIFDNLICLFALIGSKQAHPCTLFEFIPIQIDKLAIWGNP